VQFDGSLGVLKNLFRDFNVPRKVVRLLLVKGRHIGLVQHCCSVALKATEGGSWLGEPSNI